MATRPENNVSLPAKFQRWFKKRGWKPHTHQLSMLAEAKEGRSTLLIAPTGGGKTLAGFLPSLVDLDSRKEARCGLHTLYISPLKALTTDIARNLQTPIDEMGLDLRVETRTGDTPQNRRQRQRANPPDMLLTTPESLALLLSYPDVAKIFQGLSTVIIDELHALAGAKRGQLLALGLARLSRLSDQPRYVGLSATVEDPDKLLSYLSLGGRKAELVLGAAGPEPDVSVLLPEGRLPWSGHYGTYAAPSLYDTIKSANTTLVFVNTRAQAEVMFRELWRLNEDNLPIALHHGSLAVEQRRRVEAAMAKGSLKAIVCTSSLDLGIDWGDVDLVVQIGAPKGVSRILQRIGRANHRFDQPSRALLVPGNRFEVLECRAAMDAIHEETLDGVPPHPGGLDVLAQHITGVACSGPFDADALFEEVISAHPYHDLSRENFDAALEFVATGGYALQVYDRYRRLRKDNDGRWRLTHPKLAQRYRMNIGTIVEQPMVKVRQKGRRQSLGEIEEWFVQWLTPGDVFQFAGRALVFQGMRETTVEVTLAPAGKEPSVPSYMGTRMPFTTHLSSRVRGYLADPKSWHDLPEQVLEWLEAQKDRSSMPAADELLIETFPRRGRFYMVIYAFVGWNGHQTLAMLVTKRMERLGLKPIGFNASDYILCIWGLEPVDDPAALFEVDILGEELEDWMAESSLLKRTFRNVAVVAGLIERRHPGQEKTGRQVTINSDLIYDVLRKYQPDHVLLRATYAEASVGLLDVHRLAAFLTSIQGKIRHEMLEKLSPLALPVMLDIGKEVVPGEADEAVLAAAADELIEEALGQDAK
ncbi:MAG: ligase-associated DNA damage response DEXH box helicase [Geminicoccaceae bacterium]